ncbi:MAG: WYL domain-containing protein [Propionibacteriaceae bacterium]|jgi:proteasome accessory factor C|nr:WYL domain-containing protein [Propionibacteriaceae bacterium]
MADTAAEQVARLLLLIPYLQRHPGIGLDQAADNFNWSPEQVRADLEVAFLCGLPGGLPGDLIEVDMDLVDGEGVIFLSNAEVLSRPLGLSLDEAAGLIVALQAIREVAAGSVHPVIDSLLAKLTGLAPETVGRTSVLLAAGDPEVRARLQRAIAAAERVELTYDGLARGKTTRPVVDPVRLELADGAAYLSAWSLERSDWRTYRLDRIVEVAPTGLSAVDHGRAPGSDAWLATLDQAASVRLLVRPAARWIAEYYPVSAQLERDDGDCEMTLPIADPGWLRWLLLRLGPAVEVLEPAQAGRTAAAEAARALAAYAGAGLDLDQS